MSNVKYDIVCAGEVMVEFSSLDNHQWQQGFGGDTFNTAVYLGRAGLNCAYMTRLGDDLFSIQVASIIAAEGLGTDHLEHIKNRQMGLYTITNRLDGERSFDYWRGLSPARELFAAHLTPPNCRYFYLSGITLAIVADQGIEHLVTCLTALRARGTLIVFDPNYRPKLWTSVAEARQAYSQILPLCQIVMPALEDDIALWEISTLEESMALYQPFDLEELIIKAPDLSCHVVINDSHLTGTAIRVKATDTTGAGDSFNAGYLAARVQGENIPQAIQAAQQLAAQVVQHRGAIMPRQLYPGT
ncbi:sugar kinase [Pseudomonadales bacterium]|nr:sugar kinase [Pseudomonadales bacterium]MDC0174770.1 sugar kinase [Pseudomonadales bacterium]MDC1306686.1 sugar kinase [Pseudomonadales bacterium]